MVKKIQRRIDEKNYFEGIMMDMHWFVNGLLGIAGGLLYLLYGEVKKDIAKQDELLSDISDKVHEIDKVVAGDYVKKKEFDKIYDKLEKIYEKLDKKADK